MRARNEKDEKVYNNVKAGDVKSFEILFERYYHSLCNFAFLYLKHEGQSEEVVSDVFVNLWNRRNEIDIHTSFKSLLYVSTRNAAISLLRKNRPGLVYDIVDINVTDNITPETLLLNSELEDAIEKLIGGLPKVSGLVLRMKKIDGLRYKEIAVVLEISEKTVENHISQALKKIRKTLELKPELEKYFRR
jgi:RNA polymerase sigma-70 factor (ECF subfamily)